MLGLSESSTKVQSSDFHVRNLHSKRVVVEDYPRLTVLPRLFFSMAQPHADRDDRVAREREKERESSRFGGNCKGYSGNTARVCEGQVPVESPVERKPRGFLGETSVTLVQWVFHN